jgi:glucose-1-phosphate cytidylyltransferase
VDHLKTVILAGGLGTRISEESLLKPKPMIEIGGKPILWHIMKIYSTYGLNDFVICLGYKGYLIKEYFINYFHHMSDITIDIQKNTTEIHQNHAEPWRITLVETGENTMTGGRLKQVAPYLDKEDFCFTYGDGLSNVNIPQLIDFHKQQKTLVTLTAIQPPARFGVVDISEDKVECFREKPTGSVGWANGGFFVVSPEALRYIENDATTWEREPLEYLTRDKQVSAFTHDGFWYAMDTLRDKNHLEELWNTKQAPWKIW